jgi:hypothetical protein
MPTVEPRARRVYLIDPITGLPGQNGVYLVPPYTFTDTYTGDQVNLNIITPAVGKQLRIIGVYITSDDANFTFTLDFATSAQTVLQVFESGQLGSNIPMRVQGNTNEPLRLNIDTLPAGKWFVLVNYDEVDP